MWITMAHERSREAGVSSSKLTIVVIIALRKNHWTYANAKRGGVVAIAQWDCPKTRIVNYTIEKTCV